MALHGRGQDVVCRRPIVKESAWARRAVPGGGAVLGSGAGHQPGAAPGPPDRHGIMHDWALPRSASQLRPFAPDSRGLKPAGSIRRAGGSRERRCEGRCGTWLNPVSGPSGGAARAPAGSRSSASSPWRWQGRPARRRPMAIKMVADSLSEGTSSFATDDDPELIKEALPFGLKTLEGLLAQLPTHRPLLRSVAAGFTSYSAGFIQPEIRAARETSISTSPARRRSARGGCSSGRATTASGRSRWPTQPPPEPDAGSEGGAGEDGEEGRARPLLDRGRLGLGDLARQGPDGPGRRRARSWTR